MTHIFRFIGELRPDQSWRLSRDEAWHFAKVLRLQVGAQIEVMDGHGTWAPAMVQSATSSEVIAVTNGPLSIEPVHAMQLCCAIGALKPGSIDDILAPMTELGIDVIHVFGQAGAAKWRLSDQALERWQRLLRQSAKQCKRAHLPRLEVHASIDNLPQYHDIKIFLDADASEAITTVLPPAAQPESVLAVIGGEGGLSAAEIAALGSRGFKPAKLGPLILRAVTAAVATSTVLSLYRQASTR